MSEPTDRDDPDTLPFPAPREPEPDHVAWAVAHLDLRRLPAGLRDSAATILGTWAEEYGVRAVRMAENDPIGDDQEPTP